MSYVGSVDSAERAYADILASQKEKATSASDLSMDDYLSLIVAEMQTQDVLNPSTDTSAMVNQLVSMTTIQAMEAMTQSVNAQYSASLVGKNVVVAAYDELGEYFEDTGLVESVIMAGEEPVFMVNGKEYTLSNIMEVVQAVTSSDEESEEATDTII